MKLEELRAKLRGEERKRGPSAVPLTPAERRDAAERGARSAFAAAKPSAEELWPERLKRSDLEKEKDALRTGVGYKSGFAHDLGSASDKELIEALMGATTPEIDAMDDEVFSAAFEAAVVAADSLLEVQLLNSIRYNRQNKRKRMEKHWKDAT